MKPLKMQPKHKLSNSHWQKFDVNDLNRHECVLTHIDRAQREVTFNICLRKFKVTHALMFDNTFQLPFLFYLK